MFKPEAKKAFMIGGMCSLSYLAVYLARNLLSVATPGMLEEDVFPQETIGSFSSAFFVCYAVGQLINGVIGDKIKAKFMVSFGLLLAGVCNLLFPFTASSALAALIVYGASGFCLSMIYGPMTKLVSENTLPVYAVRCSVGYTFASFFGSPLAGLLAAYLTWQMLFHVGAVTLFVMGTLCFIIFHIWEKRGLIRYGTFVRTRGAGVRVLFKRDIVRFTIVALLTGVTRTSVVFWLPTYLNQRLGFTPEQSSLIFTVATLVISVAAFLAIFLYERLHRNMLITMLWMFLISTVCFFGAFLVTQPVWNIVLMILAILTADAAAAVMWSVYCPSLFDTGMVSGATGFLDFCSYMAAAISSRLFAGAAVAIGWEGLVLVWFGLMAIGVVVSVPWKKPAAPKSE